MKIPKYVQKLIDRRCKLANQLATVCWELDEWLDKNKIECESCDTHTGVEIYCNPYNSKMRIMKAIAAYPTERRCGVMTRIKQLFCRHKYADKNLDIVEINHYTDTIRLRNYCVKCGKPYEVKLSYSCVFGEVESEIKKRTPQKEG